MVLNTGSLSGRDAERKERREMQDRYMAVIERLSLPAPATPSTPHETPPTTSNGDRPPRRPRAPRSKATTPEAPTLASALGAWLTGGR